MKRTMTRKWVISLLCAAVLSAGCGSSEDSSQQPGGSPAGMLHAASLTLSPFETQNIDAIIIKLVESNHARTLVEVVSAPAFFLTIDAEDQTAASIQKNIRNARHSNRRFLIITAGDRSMRGRKLTVGVPANLPVTLDGRDPIQLTPGQSFEIDGHELRRRSVISDGMPNRFAGPQ